MCENFILNHKYQHLFFDLDRTLWDFEKSALETFSDMFRLFDLKQVGIPSCQEFFAHYSHHNEQLWDMYRDGKIEKELLRDLRFALTLKDFGVENQQLATDIGTYYVEESPRKVNLFPHCHETLEYLRLKYNLHLITNGFSEVQEIKLKSSKLDVFFEEVITSEEAGVKKPNPQIFRYAFSRTGAQAGNSLMIGDDVMVDIVGAQQVGMDQVLFDPHHKHNPMLASFHINDLLELKALL